MKKFTTAILVAAAISSTSCKKDVVGNGPITTETRAAQYFTAIDLQMNGNVYYTSSADRKIEVTAKQSIHDMLETVVIDNRLVIRYRNGKKYDADETIRINISGPDVNALLLNTSGSIYCMNDIQVASLTLRSYGSGSIYLRNVYVNYIDAEGTVSGNISATGGTANSAKMKTDASSTIDLSGVATKSATARTIGSGSIKTKVSDNLDVTIQGSGSVYFSGYPSVSTHISGSGRLVRL